VGYRLKSMLGGWVNPHREQQTIPQGQTSKPAQIFPHANGQRTPGKASLATFAGAPGATHRARPRSLLRYPQFNREELLYESFSRGGGQFFWWAAGSRAEAQRWAAVWGRRRRLRLIVVAPLPGLCLCVV